MKNIYSKPLTLSLMLAATLSACGGGDAAAPTKPKPPRRPTTPTESHRPSDTSDDYVLQNVVPQYQEVYGSITITKSIQYNGVTVKAGTYTWAGMYTSHIRRMVCQGNDNNCNWSNVNYGDVYNHTQTSSNIDSYGVAEYRKPNPAYYGNTTLHSNFAFIFNALVAVNYNYYSDYNGYQYYNPNYHYQGSPWGGSNQVGGSLYISTTETLA